MPLSTVLLLAVALSMDAFAVAVASGCALRAPHFRHYARLSACFGFFQFLMPVLGWHLGLCVRDCMEAWDHWIAFALLAWVGDSMLCSALESMKNSECGRPATDPAAGHRMWVLGVATSLDALAVGLSLALLQTPIWGPAALTGVVCALLTACGLYLGKSLARLCALNGRAELLGGLTLLLIACNILREHHVFD